MKNIKIFAYETWTTKFKDSYTVDFLRFIFDKSLAPDVCIVIFTIAIFNFYFGVSYSYRDDKELI